MAGTEQAMDAPRVEDLLPDGSLPELTELDYMAMATSTRPPPTSAQSQRPSIPYMITPTLLD